LSYRTPFVIGLELETPEDEEEASVAHGHKKKIEVLVNYKKASVASFLACQTLFVQNRELLIYILTSL
jgi:hypothetical protein